MLSNLFGGNTSKKDKIQQALLDQEQYEGGADDKALNDWIGSELKGGYKTCHPFVKDPTNLAISKSDLEGKDGKAQFDILVKKIMAHNPGSTEEVNDDTTCEANHPLNAGNNYQCECKKF